MVGAVLVRQGAVLGRGWHRKAGGAHAEVEALQDARQRGHSPRGATLYVTLEPCCTHGRTPPCTEAILAASIQHVVVGADDPNPKHAGRAFQILRRAGIAVTTGVLGEECATLNEAFNHWIVHRTPWVTVKSAMTLDGKIATSTGESKWITGERARAHAMKLRRASDAILVGVNTVLADDPSLTRRSAKSDLPSVAALRRTEVQSPMGPRLRRIVLDSLARTPLTARVVADAEAAFTTLVVSPRAAKRRVAALAQRVRVLVAPPMKSAIRHPPSGIDLPWLLRTLGSEDVTSLLVEGGGEINASFLLGGFAHRIAFFYAPKILGGRTARKAVAGEGVGRLEDIIELDEIRWQQLGPDLLLTARVQ